MDFTQTRTRYQQGCLTREKRKSSPDRWIFRWRERTPAGSVNRKIVLGTVETYKTRSAAERAVAAFRIEINDQQAPQAKLRPLTLGELASHYLRTEFPEDLTQAPVQRAYSTAVTYKRYLRLWILPKWESASIIDIRPIQVEDWLRQLSGTANATRAKIRNIMSALFRHGIRHEFLPREEASNPIRYVRQSAASDVTHLILTKEQIAAILTRLREPIRTLVLLGAFTGLRISELLGLQWSDIDFETRELRVSRAVVYGRVGRCKTKTSQRPVPLDEALIDSLRTWRTVTPFNAEGDWVFASARLDGKKPLTPRMLLTKHVQPAAVSAGVQAPVGFHTFRRTMASMLIANGESVKVTQELLGHANAKMTLDLYAQATTTGKREAQSRVVAMTLPKSSANGLAAAG